MGHHLNLTGPGAPPRPTELGAALSVLRAHLNDAMARAQSEQVPTDEWTDLADHLASCSAQVREHASRLPHRVGDPGTADLVRAMMQVGHMLVEECTRVVLEPPPARRFLAMAEHTQALAELIKRHAAIDVDPGTS